MKNLILSSSAVLALAAASSFGEILPASQRAAWQGNVGVEGGIPNRKTIFRTLPPSSTTSDINITIAACPSNQVVQLAPGTFHLSGQILFDSKSGVTLRGAGPDST